MDLSASLAERNGFDPFQVLSNASRVAHICLFLANVGSPRELLSDASSRTRTSLRPLRRVLTKAVRMRKSP